MTYSIKLISFIMMLSIMSLFPFTKAFPQSNTSLESLTPPNSYRIYNEKSEYQGRAEWREYGRYRLYTKDGKYSGYAEPRPYGQTRVYDKNSKFKGSVRSK
jgi:hypothetical protein